MMPELDTVSDEINLNKSRYHSDYYNSSASIKNIKTLIWAYIILLIFEGALRKWILPGLASPLLLIRDPIAVALIFLSWKKRLVNFNIYIILLTVIGTVSFFTAIFFGHGNLLVAIFGFRTLVLHFPVIFIMGAALDRDDVIKIGKFILWITIPITLLLILQFYSPQSAWVNRGVGGDTAGAGFAGAMGFFRPPTTFSFSTGTTSYYSLVACFVLFFWMSPKKYIDFRILLAASIGVLLSIPFSISRSLFFSILVSCFFVVLASSRQPKNLGKILLVILGVFFILIILSQVGIFQKATDVFTSRLSGANEAEGGISGTFLDRYLGGMIGAITQSSNLPFWGYGIGMGTNVGSILLSGKVQFLISEGEWGRLIGELGVLLGASVIIIRLIVTTKIGIASYKKLSIGDLLPWILFSYCLLTLPQGQWGQPNALGFSIIAAGLTIGALRSPVVDNNHIELQPKVD